MGFSDFYDTLISTQIFYLLQFFFSFKSSFYTNNILRISKFELVTLNLGIKECLGKLKKNS